MNTHDTSKHMSAALEITLDTNHTIANKTG